MCNPLWGAVCSCRRSRRTRPWSSFSSVSVTPPRTKRRGPSSVQRQPHPARAPQHFHCTKYSGTKWKRGLISVVENLICTCKIMSLFVRTCHKNHVLHLQSVNLAPFTTGVGDTVTHRNNIETQLHKFSCSVSVV